MPIEHKDIPDARLHEIKGAAGASAGQVPIATGTGSTVFGDALPAGTSSAAAGAVFRANGAGSGSYLRMQGWGQYQDSRRTVGSPVQTLTAGVRTQFLCNGLFLAEEHLPEDAAGSLWNTTTNKHVPIAEYDIYHMRIGFYAENYGGTTPYIEIDLDIGGSIGQIYWRDVSLRKAGAQVKTSAAFPVFSGSTYLANGGTFYLTYQGTGTCDVYANDILIVRESKNYV